MLNRKNIKQFPWEKNFDEMYEAAQKDGWAMIDKRLRVKSHSPKNNIMPPTKRKLFSTPQYAKGGPKNKKNKVRLVTTTPKGTKQVSYRPASLTARSGGKFKTRKYKPSKKVKRAAAGINMTEEISKLQETAAGKQTLWLGHGINHQTLRWNVMRLIIKKLFSKAGGSIIDFNAGADYVTNGDLIELRYETTQINTSVIYNQGTTLTQLPGQAAPQINTSWDAIAFYFASQGIANLADPTISLKSIVYTPSTNAAGTSMDRPQCRMDLQHFMLDIYWKSSMKIQNRTQNTSVDAEAVDNVPLYGKSYEGNGNGVTQTTGLGGFTTTPLVANTNSGIILGSDDDPGLKEPIHAYYFTGVTKAGKAKIEPGEIKTSVLTYKKRISLDRFMKLSDTAVFTTTRLNARVPLGKFRFFALERMIQTAVDDKVSVAFEINAFYAINGFNRISNYTAPIFRSTIL